MNHLRHGSFSRYSLQQVCILAALILFCGGLDAKPITNWTRDDLLAAKAEWHRQGFKLDLNEFQLTNSSLAQVQTAAALTNFGFTVSPNLGTQEITPMKPVSETHSLLISSQTALPNYRQEDVWPILRESLSDQKEMLDRVRAAVRQTRIHFDLKPRPGGDILLPHLASFKKCALTFSQSALLNLHDGKRAEAWDDLVTLATMTAHWDVEPIEISHLVRGALLKITYATLWEMLSRPGWSQAQLTDLQQLLEPLDLFSNLPDLYALQRATLSANFAAARQPDSSFMDDLKTAVQHPRQTIPMVESSWQRRTAQKEWAEKWSYPEEGLILEDLISKEIALKKALQQKTWQQMRPIWLPALTNQPSTRGLQQPRMLSRLNIQRITIATAAFAQGSRGGSLGAVIDAEAHRRLMLTTLAIERYRLEHAAIPSSLDVLVPEFLKSVPEDPIDGKPLRYLPETNGEFLLYSIALDEQDDGGKQNLRAGWDRPRRGATFDWLWPKRTTIAPPQKRYVPTQSAEDDKDNVDDEKK